MPIDRTAAVQRYLAGPQQPVVPRDAATVLVLRDGPDGPEVFMLRRHGRMAFGPGMHVFPGGAVDPADRVDAARCAGPSPSHWATLLGCDHDPALALLCAAVRETFEECGLLLAGTDTTGVVDAGDLRAWEPVRRSLVERRSTLGAVLDRHGLSLRLDLLRPAGRWITPVFSPRRYDTRFFVTALPAGSSCRDVGEESDSSVWISARQGLDEYFAGTMPMMLATADALRGVARHPDVASVLAAAAPPPGARIVRAIPAGDGFRFVVDGSEGAVDEATFLPAPRVPRADVEPGRPHR